MDYLLPVWFFIFSFWSEKYFLALQVEAIRISDIDRRERMISTISGFQPMAQQLTRLSIQDTVFSSDEELFIRQLYRRAQLLDQHFNACVVKVILDHSVEHTSVGWDLEKNESRLLIPPSENHRMSREPFETHRSSRETFECRFICNHLDAERKQEITSIVEVHYTLCDSLGSDCFKNWSLEVSSNLERPPYTPPSQFRSYIPPLGFLE